MNTKNYEVGTKLVFTDPQSGESFRGEVIPEFKIIGGICVSWETGLISSYDTDFLDQYTHEEKVIKCPLVDKK